MMNANNDRGSLFLGYSIKQTRVFAHSLSGERQEKKWNEKIMLPLPSNAL
jgi:hypothetical protein